MTDGPERPGLAGLPELPDEIIDCIDCGGRCHLLDRWALEDPPGPGGIVRYRCEDCLDVWHLVVPEDDAAP